MKTIFSSSFSSAYKVKSLPLKGSSYKEIKRKALNLFKEISRKSKRQPYIRSKYFKGKKVFFTYFWEHLYQKTLSEKKRRLIFFPCAVELIESTTLKPTLLINPNKSKEILYRFSGTTSSQRNFHVQIKDTKGKINFMSVFPVK